MWMVFAPGSGIWFNLGVTISFAEHADAYSHFKVAAGGDMNQELSKAAAAAGYDSIQFLAHVDHTNYQCDTHHTGRPGFDYMGLEIVATKLVGTYACGSAGGAATATGVVASPFFGTGARGAVGAGVPLGSRSLRLPGGQARRTVRRS